MYPCHPIENQPIVTTALIMKSCYDTDNNVDSINELINLIVDTLLNGHIIEIDIIKNMLVQSQTHNVK